MENIDGKIYKGENKQDYLIIETRENVALLKSLTKNDYVVANGYRISNDNKISWDSGSYYQNLNSSIIKFDELTLNNAKKLENLKEALKEANNFVSFGVIVDEKYNNFLKREIKKYCNDKGCYELVSDYDYENDFYIAVMQDLEKEDFYTEEFEEWFGNYCDLYEDLYSNGFNGLDVKYVLPQQDEEEL